MKPRLTQADYFSTAIHAYLARNVNETSGLSDPDRYFDARKHMILATPLWCLGLSTGNRIVLVDIHERWTHPALHALSLSGTVMGDLDDGSANYKIAVCVAAYERPWDIALNWLLPIPELVILPCHIAGLSASKAYDYEREAVIEGVSDTLESHKTVWRTALLARQST